MRRHAFCIALVVWLCCISSTGCGRYILPETETSSLTTEYELIRNIEYGQGGGHALLLDIYRPLEPVAAPTPAIICMHGGGWSVGDKYPSRFEFLAEAGFFCVSINYRLTGEAIFPAAVEDCKCAVRWLRANASAYNVDPDAIGVCGSSAGGHLAMMVACADEGAGLEGNGGWEGVSSRVQAVCSYFGPADLTAFPGESMIKNFLGITIEEDSDVFLRASPIYYVSAGDPPLLMLQGDMDMLIPVAQARRMQEAYKKQGLDASLIVIKNAGHGLNQVGNKPVSPPQEEYEQSVTEFFKRNLLK